MDILDDMEDLVFLHTLLTNSGRRGNREIFKSREKFGFYATGVNVLIEKNPDIFLKSTRMSYEKFTALLNLIEPWLQKRSRRKPIEPEQRLFITLHFLAHGCALHVLSMQFRIGLETARSVVLETCEVLWKVLGPLYVSPPNSTDWKDIANNFLKTTGLPNCLGALEGKHIRITCPPKSGSQYFNYKKFNSIVLLAVCDSNYAFTLIDVGAYGSQSDGGVLQNAAFGKKLFTNQLDIPAEAKLPGSDIIFPYYFVADAAFPLRTNIMKPYAMVTDTNKDNFNKILCSARIRIEIAFGILTARWRVLRTCICFSPENAKKFCTKVVLATVVLHNYLRPMGSNSDSTFAEQSNDATLESINRAELHTANASPQDALQFRTELCNYLNQ